MSTVTAPAGPTIAFPLVTARLLGWHVQVDAHPGTGFATPDGHDAQHPSFAVTVGCVAAAHPRVVIVALGADDAELTPSGGRGPVPGDQGAGGPTGVAAGRRSSSLAFAVRWYAVANPGAVRDAVRAAAQAAHVGFIDPVAEGWITGERTDPGPATPAG